MTSRVRALVIALSLLGVAFLFPARSHAAVPSIQFVPVSFGHVAPSISAVCGFEVTVQDQGTIRIATFFDNSGNPIRLAMNFSDFKITFSGNGHAITSPSPDPLSVDLTTGTTTAHGLQLVIRAPGGGVLGVQTGTVVLDGSGAVLFQSGQTISDTPAAVCAALA